MEEKTVDYTIDYVRWNDSMKADYTILIPNMLPNHFDVIKEILRSEGYNCEVLKNESRSVIDEGLKHVHNDTCYPCLCVVGQYIDALKSGKYDVDHTAVLITQTGGGCRASNYLPLIRKALAAEFPQVPVISINFSHLESNSKLSLKVGTWVKVLMSIVYSDAIMWCYNQTKPYEVNEGQADKVRKEMIDYVVDRLLNHNALAYKKILKNIITHFAAVPRNKQKKIRVGIVGEIYIKYSSLGNNGLEKFLIGEGCEPIVPTLMEFVTFMIANTINDKRLYGYKGIRYPVYGLIYRLVLHVQDVTIKLYRKYSDFDPIHDFRHLRSCADKVLNQGVKMGEGWLIPAEMAALVENGVANIVCAQPFGCLPNHIAGKGAIRTLKNLYPDSNIVAVDYDPSATKVNQENRIKLMLATARENASRANEKKDADKRG